MREFDALVFPALDESAWQRMAAKLNVAMEDRNPGVFLTALASVVDAIGLEPAAQRLGFTPARLARVVGPNARPSFEEVRAVVSGLGFRWGVAQRTTEKSKPSRVRSPRKLTTHCRSEHDTRHITPAGRSVLLDLAAEEDSALARAKSGSRGDVTQTRRRQSAAAVSLVWPGCRQPCRTLARIRILRASTLEKPRESGNECACGAVSAGASESSSSAFKSRSYPRVRARFE
jgi:DNA-binding phage protein